MLWLLSELSETVCLSSGHVVWGYSVQQSTWLFKRLFPVVWVARRGQVRAYDSERVPVGFSPVVDSPPLQVFLSCAAVCALLSLDLLLVPLA